MSTAVHSYTATLLWDGNTGEGTRSYTSYSRRHRVRMPGKPELVGSADPAFRGEAELHNPEDLFLTAIAACHMLSYLSLCARQGVRVLAYEDHAEGTMAEHAGGGGQFTGITLHPRVTVDCDERIELAARLPDAGIHVLAARDVVVQRLHQDEPGQLGKLTRRMAEAGVNIQVLYSDHDHQLILVVDDIATARVVSEAWMRER